MLEVSTFCYIPLCDRDHRISRGNFRPKTVSVDRKRNLRSRRCDRPDLAEFRGVASLSVDLLRRRVHEIHADKHPVTGRGDPGFSLPHRTDPVAHFRKRAGGCVESCERRDICPRVEGRSAGAGIGHSHKLWGASSCREQGMCGPTCPEGERKVVITSTYRYVLSPPAP